MPPGLVAPETIFDKNPRLATVVGFLVMARDRQSHVNKYMSTKIANARRTAPKKTAPRPELGQVMAGSDILVRALEREGVECVFAYPGGASMEIHQALTRSTIRTIDRKSTRLNSSHL